MDQLIDKLDQLEFVFVIACCGVMIVFGFVMGTIVNKLNNIAKAIQELKK